jgi:SAM-dependent methyltransferase
MSAEADAFARFEAAGWEAKASGYHGFFEPITTRAVAALLDAAAVGASTRVLDLASGPGYVAARAAARGAAVTGVDMTEAMVALARELSPGLEFRRADVERLPFADGAFDAVVGNFVVLHMARPETAAAEWARVLAPGGRLALSMWSGPERCRLLGVFVDAVAEVGPASPANVPAGPPFFRFADDRELEDLLRGAGLIDVEVEELSFAHRLSGPDEFWNGLLDGTVRASVLVLEQPPPVQERIRAAFDRLALEYEVDGALAVPVAVKIAAGRKPG